MRFEIGALYNRRLDIHEVFGGQKQGGISTPSASEFIFLFTGEAGKAHGYDDFVDERGFHLYGEGQAGDMQFVRGDLAIRGAVTGGASGWKQWFVASSPCRSFVHQIFQKISWVT